MTPEERIEKLFADHDITLMLGAKHHSPGQAAQLVAAAIRDAVAAEQDRWRSIVLAVKTEGYEDWLFEVMVRADRGHS